jgi:hypothetical protein
MSAHPAPQPHGAIREVFPNVFVLQGSVRMGPLIRINRNMVILRDGDALTVISPIRLRAADEPQLDALGRVAHVVKLGFHGMDDPYYLSRYDATYWLLPEVEAPEGQTIARLGIDPFPVPNVDVIPFTLTQRPEAALHHRGVDRGLLITVDALQNWENTSGCSTAGKLLTRAMGFLHPVNIGPPWLKMMTPEGGSLRPDFERLMQLEFDHLIGGHGVPRVGAARPALAATLARVFG